MVLLNYYVLVLLYALTTERIGNCEQRYNYFEPVIIWQYSPEIGTRIMQNNPMMTRILSPEQKNPYTQSKEYPEEKPPSNIMNAQCPNGDSYCENIPNYPHELLRQVINSNNFNDQLFKTKIPLNTFTALRESEDETVCRSIREVIRPMVASNYMGKQKFILNQARGEEFVQQIHVEKCHPSLDPQSACGVGQKKTGCKEKYLAWRLLSFSVDGEVSVDSFLFPSACSCMYIHPLVQ